MNYIFRANVVIAICVLLAACSQATQIAPSSIPTIDIIETSPSTATPVPSVTATIESTPPKAYIPPALVPTIDPTLIPGLLSKAFSVQTIEGVNGHNMRQITGWDRGFGGGRWVSYCDGYYWLDANHLLLYPTTGQVGPREGYEMPVNAAWQPVVINLESGILWLPPVNTSSTQACKHVYWSRELGIIITPENRDNISTVSTYTYDGYKLASYPSSLLDVSPSGTKILVTDDTVIDLRTNKKIELNWNLEDYWELYWTSDETRIYRCCYFYADLTTGISHRFEVTDLQDINGNHVRSSVLSFRNGFWVRDDTYFLVWWLAVDDGDIKYLPMFDPATKIFYDVREAAGIPEDFTSLYTPVSPDGNYVWMEGWNESYLVNLTTFKSQHYTYTNPYSYTDIDWSSDSKFTWFEIYDPDTKSTEFKILSISDMKLNPLPVTPPSELEHLWHPTNNILVYPAKDKNTLIFLDASTMSVRELPFKDQDSRYKISNLAWSPNGEKITFVTEDSVLWQVDYPTLENLEHIMSSIFTIREVRWSPDSKSIAFINGSDIYIVETGK